MIQGIRLTQKEFDNTIIKVDEILSKLKTFNSPTYQKQGIPLIDGKVLMIQPTQKDFIEALKPLNLEWIEIDYKEIKRVEI